VLYANQAFVDQIGVPADRLIGSVLIDMFPRDQRQVIRERFRARCAASSAA
jgi:PAS domain-containing protein